MKKTLSLLLALLMLLAMPASAFASDTLLGTETLGFFDYASVRDVLGEAQIDNVYQFASISSTDQYNLARITVLYENCGNNTDFNAVTGYIRNQYNTRPADDDRFNYKVLSEETIQLDGMTAFKISAEKGDLYGFCDTYSYVSYVLANSASGFVHIQVVAPKDGWKDDNGNAFRPSIAELCSMIESTYTRH